jgi:uncharacterized membrane protein
MDHPLPRRVAANPTQQNIDAIAKLEHQALGRRTITERASEVITKIVGNMTFLLAQLVLMSSWILVNDSHSLDQTRVRCFCLECESKP